jgi:hypothetical protein
MLEDSSTPCVSPSASYLYSLVSSYPALHQQSSSLSTSPFISSSISNLNPTSVNNDITGTPYWTSRISHTRLDSITSTQSLFVNSIEKDNNIHHKKKSSFVFFPEKRNTFKSVLFFISLCLK